VHVRWPVRRIQGIGCRGRPRRWHESGVGMPSYIHRRRPRLDGDGLLAAAAVQCLAADGDATRRRWIAVDAGDLGAAVLAWRRDGVGEVFAPVGGDRRASSHARRCSLCYTRRRHDITRADEPGCHTRLWTHSLIQ
jgi:hypothetical protein